MTRKTLKNHYEVLQVDRRASPAVIRGAYLALLKTARNHPDLGGSDAQAQTINEAFSVLSDAEARREYDRELGPAHESTGYPVPMVRTQYILICPSCRKRNLVDDARALGRMKCGACKAVLLPPRQVPMENDHARAYRLGIYLFDKGLLDRSLREFEAAVRLQAQSPQYHYWMGRCLYRMHQFTRSRRAFQAAVTLNPRRFHFQFWLGQINYTLQNFSEAVTCFAAARKARPRHSPTLLRIASSYFHLQQFAKAIAVLEEAIRQEPTRLQLYTLLGVVYLASKNPSAALQAFRRAERLSPGDALTRRYINLIQQR